MILRRIHIEIYFNDIDFRIIVMEYEISIQKHFIYIFSFCQIMKIFNTALTYLGLVCRLVLEWIKDYFI